MKIRKKTSKHWELLETLIEFGLLNAIDEKFLDSESIELQIEGVWIIANVSSEHADDVIESEIYKTLLNLLMTAELSEGCLRTIANISAENDAIRESLLQHRLLYHIISLRHTEPPLEVHQLIALILLNITKLTGLSNDHVLQILPLLNKYLQNDDFDILHSSLWALHNLMNNVANKKLFTTYGTIQLLVGVLKGSHTKCAAMALDMLTHLTDSLDDHCINNLFSLIANLLKSEGGTKKTKEVLHFILLITEDRQCWKIILDNTNLLEKILDLMATENIGIVEEAMKIISLIATRGNYEDVKKVINKKVIESMCNLLTEDQNTDLLIITLETLDVVMSKAEGFLNYIIFVIEECGGQDKLETLMLHFNQKIGDDATNILAQFFIDDDTASFFAPTSNSSFVSESNLSDKI